MPAANKTVFDLMQYDAESLEDVKAYLAKRTERSELIHDWITARNLQREQFVAAVAEKSEKKFIKEMGLKPRRSRTALIPSEFS
ncbi:hypothetical protein QT999_23770 [Microcoleus sp. S36b_A2]